MEQIKETISTLDGSGIKYHTFSDIGTYTVFPKQYSQRIFPSKVYGRIAIDDNIEKTGSLGIMCRE